MVIPITIISKNDVQERRSREASGEPGQDSEPGYDLVSPIVIVIVVVMMLIFFKDDDGLPGAPLPPLQQSEDLYPR